MIIDDIHITYEGFTPDEGELQNYVDFVTERVEGVFGIHIKAVSDDEVEITYLRQNRPFERIRRITGYLVGTLDRWNDSKQAEEKDRVKHQSDRHD